MSTTLFLRKRAYTKMFIVVFVTMMLTATLSIVSVKASPITITISPNTGPVGTIVTVSGDGASADGEVRVYVGFFFMGFFLATTRANSTGGYSVNITVPAVAAGSYNIVVHDITTGDTNSDTFTVQPKIILTPKEGSYRDKVTVEGYGFYSGSLITLTFDGNDVTPTPQPSTDDFGSFETSFVVPSKPTGTYTVTASDGTNNDIAQFTLIPKITLAPKTSGPKATLVMVNGAGFASSVEVTVEFNAINVTMYPQAFTNPNGSFMEVFFVPDVPNGVYTVKATDEPGNSASAPFVVPSAIMTLEPDTTFESSIVTVVGSGFPPNAPVLLYFEDTLVTSLLDLMTSSSKLLADEYGAYKNSFIVPVTKPGIYTVRAYSMIGDGGPKAGEEIASASLTIVNDPLLENIEDEITDIIIPKLDTIKANLTDINAKVVSIDGNVATIETDIGTIKADVSDVQAEVVPTGFEFGAAATILALIAAVGAWLSAILIRKKTPPTSPKPKSKSK